MAHLVQYVWEVTEEATIDPLEGMIIVTVTVTEVMKGMGHQDTTIGGETGIAHDLPGGGGTDHILFELSLCHFLGDL